MENQTILGFEKFFVEVIYVSIRPMEAERKRYIRTSQALAKRLRKMVGNVKRMVKQERQLVILRTYDQKIFSTTPPFRLGDVTFQRPDFSKETGVLTFMPEGSGGGWHPSIDPVYDTVPGSFHISAHWDAANKRAIGEIFPGETLYRTWLIHKGMLTSYEVPANRSILPRGFPPARIPFLPSGELNDTRSFDGYNLTLARNMYDSFSPDMVSFVKRVRGHLQSCLPAEPDERRAEFLEEHVKTMKYYFNLAGAYTRDCEFLEWFNSIPLMNGHEISRMIPRVKSIIDFYQKGTGSRLEYDPENDTPHSRSTTFYDAYGPTNMINTNPFVFANRNAEANF